MADELPGESELDATSRALAEAQAARMYGRASLFDPVLRAAERAAMIRYLRARTRLWGAAVVSDLERLYAEFHEAESRADAAFAALRTGPAAVSSTDPLWAAWHELNEKRTLCWRAFADRWHRPTG